MKNLFPNIKENVDVKPLTTFGVGGKIKWYLKVSSPEELVEAFLKAKNYYSRRKVVTPTKASGLLLMAGGSNLVFSDDTYPGLLIHYLNHSAKIETEDRPRMIRGRSSVSITCEAGLPLSKLISFAIKNNLAGLEALSGIPGTVGGAIVGNAGAYGQSISDHIEKIEILDPLLRGGQGGVNWLSKNDSCFVYRNSIFKKEGKNWLVLRAVFNLEKGDGRELRKKSKEIIEIRNVKYVPGLKCPGSYFKNVLVEKISTEALAKIDQSKIRDGKIPAGYLLEEVGAKGMREGEAVVANFHGNLIINEGHATYADVIKLVTKLKKLVKDRFRIELEEEVRYML